jgi:hypothetical protein
MEAQADFNGNHSRTDYVKLLTPKEYCIMKRISIDLNNIVDKDLLQENSQKETNSPVSLTVDESLQVSKVVSESPEQAVKDMSGCTKGVLNALLFYQVKHPSIFPSYELLSTITGYTRRQVIRCMKKLMELGLVSQEKRSYQSNIYKLHPIFNSLSFRAAAGKYLPSLRLMPAFLLLSINLLCSQVQTTKVTASINKVVINKNGTRESYSRNNNAAPETVSLLHKKERRMEKARKAVEEFKSLPLTAHGKIMFMVYPAEAIKYADDALYNSKTRILNPLGFVKALCEEYCSKNKLTPDWSEVNRLRKKAGPFFDQLYEVTENVAITRMSEEARKIESNRRYAYQSAPIIQHNPGGDTYKPFVAKALPSDFNKDSNVAAAIKTERSAGRMNPFLAIMEKGLTDTAIIQYPDIVRHPEIDKPIRKSYVDHADIPIAHEVVREIFEAEDRDPVLSFVRAEGL